MYVQRNIGARPRNHCCRGKQYYIFVCVRARALVCVYARAWLTAYYECVRTCVGYVVERV
jgi:hypothetical protein